jgi:hypothetical protein
MCILSCKYAEKHGFASKTTCYVYVFLEDTYSIYLFLIHSPAEKAEHHYYLKIYRRGMWFLFFNQSFETF